MNNRRLRALRHLAGKSQELLAFQANVSQAKISRAERGVYKLNEEEKEKIAEALETSPEELFSEA